LTTEAWAVAQSCATPGELHAADEGLLGEKGVALAVDRKVGADGRTEMAEHGVAEHREWHGVETDADAVRLADADDLARREEPADAVRLEQDTVGGIHEDNTGAVRVKEGEKMDEMTLYHWDWSIEGVSGINA